MGTTLTRPQAGRISEPGVPVTTPKIVQWTHKKAIWVDAWFTVQVQTRILGKERWRI